MATNLRTNHPHCDLANGREVDPVRRILFGSGHTEIGTTSWSAKTVGRGGDVLSRRGGYHLDVR